jgi:hypothetical protein
MERFQQTDPLYHQLQDPYQAPSSGNAIKTSSGTVIGVKRSIALTILGSL